MRRVLSTRVFLNDRLSVALLEKLSRAGVHEIEICCARRHLDYRNRAQLEELKRWFRDAEMRVLAMRAPLYSEESEHQDSAIRITETKKVERIQASDEIKRAADVAEMIPFRYLIQRIGEADEDYSQDRADAAFNTLDELRVFCAHLDVELLLENAANDFSSADRLELFLSMTHLPLGYSFDTVAAAGATGLAEEFERMKERIRMVHLADTDGESERRLPPLDSAEGVIDWSLAMESIGSLDPDTPAVMDFDHDPEHPNKLEVVTRCFDLLEEAAAHGR